MCPFATGGACLNYSMDLSGNGALLLLADTTTYTANINIDISTTSTVTLTNILKSTDKIDATWNVSNNTWTLPSNTKVLMTLQTVKPNDGSNGGGPSAPGPSTTHSGAPAPAPSSAKSAGVKLSTWFVCAGIMIAFVLAALFMKKRE
jgi:hypothetical protein